jgi:hypothetical protein
MDVSVFLVPLVVCISQTREKPFFSPLYNKKIENPLVSLPHINQTGAPALLAVNGPSQILDEYLTNDPYGPAEKRRVPNPRPRPLAGNETLSIL